MMRTTPPGILCLALLALAGCTSTRTTRRDTAIPTGSAPLDLRFYREPEENRLFLELDKLIRQWRDALLEERSVVAQGVAEQVERYSRANYDTIMRGIDSENRRYRIVAAAALGFSKRQDAAGALLRAARDPDEAVAGNALLSLGRLSPLEHEVIRSVLGLLGHDSAWVRSNALIVLGKNVEPRQAKVALKPLLEAIRDPDDVARNNAVGALARLRSPDSVDALVGLLKDSYPRIRIRAAVALGEIGRRRAVPALIERLADESTEVALAAHVALTRITGLELAGDAEAWRAWWQGEAKGEGASGS